MTRDLAEDLRDAYERLRETVVEFGAQRIYASHKSIMFARETCYFFVRPRKRALEIVFFLGRVVRAPQVRRVVEASRVKRAHVVHVSHRDEVESPITDWLQEAYDVSDALSGAGRTATRAKAGVKKAARKRPLARKAGAKKAL